MKTINHPFLKTSFKFALLAVVFLAFSCSQEPLSGENLEATNAKSKSKNDKKSGNAVLKTLVKGASLNGANGLDIGPDGHLYVGSVNGQNITVINKHNGKIIDRISDGVDSPDDVVFSPDGKALYWTDILTGFVGRLKDGVVKKQFVAPGVNPIRFSEDERLFTALDFLGDGLYELDPELDLPPRLIISCPEGFGLGFFNSFDTRMEDGRLILYGPLFALNLVIAIDVDAIADETVFPADLSGLFAALSSGSIRIVAGSLPPEDSDLFNPAAAKFSPEGTLYVLDQAGKLWEVNPDGNDEKTLLASLQPGLDNMTFDEDGRLYMSNNDEGWVAEILKSGQARILRPGGIIMPQGLVAMAGPNNQDILYEADLFQLRQFNGSSGQQENSYKGYLIPVAPEVGLAPLILPMNVTADGDNLIICSFFSPGLQVWNPDEGVIENYTAPQVAAPIDAVRVQGELYVNDIGLGGVIRLSDNALILPGLYSGMAANGETFWVADYFNGDIVQVDIDGGTPIINIFEFDLQGPEGLALDLDGNLLVVEEGASRLSRIDDLSSGEVVTVVEGLKLFKGSLPDFPPYWFFDGVTVGPSGDIYITGGGENAIYKIKQNKVN
jgi:sugar lactone lactonase YvrE